VKGVKHEDDVNCRNTNLSENMIVAVVNCSLSDNCKLTLPPQKKRKNWDFNRIRTHCISAVPYNLHCSNNSAIPKDINVALLPHSLINLPLSMIIEF